MTKSLLQDEVKVKKNTIDDIRLRSNLSNNNTKIITEKSFFIQYQDLLNYIQVL